VKRHFLVVNQYYWPSIAATSQLVTDLCEQLAGQGHQVTVVCSQSAYGVSGTQLRRTENKNGVRILRLPSFSFGRNANWGRLLNYGSFSAGLLPTLLGVRNVDVMMSLSTPPILASVVLGAARLKKAKFIYWCQDIYPDIAVALGVLKSNSWIERELNRLKKWTLAKADKVIAPSDGMGSVLVEKSPCDLVTIPNWSVSTPPQSGLSEAQAALRAQLGIQPEKKLIIYAGNMGRAHDFSALLSCWESSAPQNECEFLLIGDGAKKESLEMAAETGRQNGWAISFSPYLPKEDLGVLLSMGWVHLLAIDVRADRLVFPSKLYGILHAGRPTWLLGPKRSEVGQWILSHGTGVVFDASNKETLRKQIVKALDEPAWLKQQSVNATRMHREVHARELALDRFTEVFVEIN
tara:strand:+ start:1385 stop:2605 length:1221 start_codon:yes stop_codon:yes gene_type:complete